MLKAKSPSPHIHQQVLKFHLKLTLEIEIVLRSPKGIWNSHDFNIIRSHPELRISLLSFIFFSGKHNRNNDSQNYESRKGFSRKGGSMCVRARGKGEECQVENFKFICIRNISRQPVPLHMLE